MLAVRKLVEPTAVSAVCVLRLEPDAATPALWGSRAVLLAAVAESIHVFDLAPASAATSPFSSVSSSELQSQFCARGHVFNVGCGVSGLLALVNQCFVVWTRDQECLLVRYQANLAAPPAKWAGVADACRVYKEDGRPTPLHNKEHHWYVVRRMRLWCPDTSDLLPMPQMGVNEGMDTVFIRFSERHVFLVCIKWSTSCAPGTKGNLSADLLRTCRWRTGNYMRAYAGTGFHYPTQSCSVATRRPRESRADHQARLERLWQSCSPFANIPDEDLIANHSVGELARHKETETQCVTSRYATLSPSSPTDDFCGVSDVWLRREAHTAPSPLMPSPAQYCGSPLGGFANVRGTGVNTAVHHAPPTLFGSRVVALKDKYASPHKSAIAVVAPRRSGRRGVEWLLLVMVSTDLYTAVYHLQRRHTPLTAHHLLLDGLVHDAAYPRQVLLCSHSGDAINDVWVALSNGAVTKFSVLALRSRWSTSGEGANLGWPSISVSGLPSSFYCRRMLPADDLIGINLHLSSPGSVGGETSPYPCACRYAIFSDGVQDAYVVDLVECRVVAAMAADGPMTDICEAPHGFVASFAKGVLRYFQPGVPLHVCGTASLAGVTDALHVARVRCSAASDSDGVAPGVYLMVSTRFKSHLFFVEAGGVRLTAADGWDYAMDEPTLAFGAGTATLAQCTATRWCVGRVAQTLPSVLSHAAIAELPTLGLVCVGIATAAKYDAGLHLAVGTGTGVQILRIADVACGPWSCITVTAHDEGVAMQVVMGRWEGGVTLAQLRLASQTSWRCVATFTVYPAFTTGSPVQRLLPLPRAGTHARWMAIHTSGEVSILTAAPFVTSTTEAPAASEVPALQHAWAAAESVRSGNGVPVTATAAVPLLRAAGGDVLNGFDGALLQPRDGAVVFFSVPLEEADTQTPPLMRRHREDDKADVAWSTRLEHTVRAVLDPLDAANVGASSWRDAVLLERGTVTGALAYDLLVAHHDKLTLLALDRHIFRRDKRAAGTALPSSRAFALVPTAPTRYVCTRQVTLPQTKATACETLVAVASSPDGEGDDLTLCVMVAAEAELATRLTTVRTTTLTTLDSVLLYDCVAHWMTSVPTPSRAAARQPVVPLFLLCTFHASSGEVQLQVVTGNPLRIVSRLTLEDVSVSPETKDRCLSIDGSAQLALSRAGESGELSMPEVLVTVAVDYGIHLFALRGHTLYFQHCVVAPECVSSVGLCYPVVTVCTQGDTSVYLQVYPVHDTTESLAPPYTTATTRPLKEYGKVSWKMRVEAREPSLGACVIAQASLYDRCVRTDLEGDVSVMFASFVPSSTKSRAALQANREDAYIGSADGPQSFLTHAVRLPSVPTKARVLRRVDAIHRRFPSQLQCNARHVTLQSLSQRKDGSARLLLLPCHDGSLYSAYELPFSIAHPLMRLEQAITDTYALDLSAAVHPSFPGRLQHTYHLRPFHVVHALQPVVGAPQAMKQACIMVDAVNEYFMLREVVRNGWSSDGMATRESASDEAAAHRKFVALDDVVQTLLTEEYSGAYTVDDCAEVLNLS
ncbi:hypothetical protein GH5_03553 [Leishmania sp. Ghana 2012 LV757]|uniref:hypothetical protein n=1 Tax=Leishmania sp. Ghana 2012 LV757 TaxID=2803181 RepID=UPI001B53E343|nr:hypothetical protein GH5_03553 [Leishmania sp. Ghana 2012 LV757]